MAGIKTSKLDSVRGSIFTQGEDAQNNFEAVVLAYTNFIAQDASFRTSQGNSQIAAVAGMNDTDSGGSHRQNKRPQGQISQVNVTDRYYTREEYAKLSKEEKAALQNLRKGRKRHRGNDDSAGMASVAAQLNALKASIRALATSGDVDDDKTVNASNQRVTNRNHSALVVRVADGVCPLSLCRLVVQRCQKPLLITETGDWIWTLMQIWPCLAPTAMWLKRLARLLMSPLMTQN
jgi:hypothetical protein